ncbi:MAG: IclR family transcriptional regulator [Acuticoccus sp.]
MSVVAVERTVGMIEALAEEPAAAELSALATRVDLPLSAAHRILTTLVERGLVVQDAATGGYQLSLRFAQLAFRSLEARAAPNIVQIALDGLAERCREYCRLAILEGDNLVWVARAQGAPAGLRYDPDMSEEVVLYATANGKAWLATLDDADVTRILTARGFAAPRALGPNAARSLDDVLSHLASVRQQGFATALEEAESGTAAVAVPFRAGSGADAPVAGTISVAGPVARIRETGFETLAAMLRDSAAEIGALWPIRAFGQSARPQGERV